MSSLAPNRLLWLTFLLAACGHEAGDADRRATATTLHPSDDVAARTLNDARSLLLVKRDAEPIAARDQLVATFGTAPDDAEAALLLARATFRLEEYPACATALDAYFVHEPKKPGEPSGPGARPDWSAEAWVLRGWIRERAGDFAGALPHYEKALALIADYPWALLRRATALGELGQISQPDQLDAAIRDCERAIAVRPGLLEAHFLLSHLARRAGRTADAEREATIHRLMNATSDNTSSTPAADAEKIAACEQLEKLLPGWIEGRVQRIQLESAAGRFEPALAAARRLAQEQPQAPEAWPLLAELLRRVEGEEKARAELKERLAKAPTIPKEARAILERIVADGFPRR